MPFLKFNNSKIIGMGVGVPKAVLPTMSNNSDYSAEDFAATTGVYEKRFSNDFTTSDLCQAATEKLLETLGWERDSIDGLIFVSQTPDYSLPATSCVLHGKLGLKKSCICLDISLGCSGWVYGTMTALSLLESGSLKRVLVLAGDARKNFFIVKQDPLFGFAGTVTAIEYDESNPNPIFMELGADGTGYDAIIVPGGATRVPYNEHSLEKKECEDGVMRHDLQTRMNGMDVFAFGVSTAPKSIKQLAKHFELDYMDYDFYVFHQANKMMNESIRKKLKLPEDKVPYSLTKFGNTSSASIPLTIVTQLDGQLEGHKKFMACGFGVGLSWGTIAFETDNLVIAPLVEL